MSKKPVPSTPASPEEKTAQAQRLADHQKQHAEQLAREQTAREEQAVRQAAHEAHVADLNTKLKTAWEKVTCVYEVTPVLKNPKDCHGLAKALSTRFRKVRFNVVYSDGDQVLYAKPYLVQIEKHTSGQEILKFEGHLADGTLWPKFEVLEGYAEGYNNAISERPAPRPHGAFPFFPHPYWNG